MPRTLTEPEISSFRERICAVATDLFSEHGYEGVTLRAITDAVGCSPMTPYHYFRDKADILATIRAGAMAQLADALEPHFERESDPMRRLRTLAIAYVDFAIERPQTYRLMFDYLQVGERVDLEVQGKRARKLLYRAYEQAVASGALRGDPRGLAHMCWSAVHGLVSLELAGQLQFGPGLKEIKTALVDTLLNGMKSGVITEESRSGKETAKRKPNSSKFGK